MIPYDEEMVDDYSDEDTVDPDQDYDHDFDELLDNPDIGFYSPDEIVSFDSPTDFDEHEMNPDDCGDPLDIEYDR